MSSKRREDSYLQHLRKARHLTQAKLGEQSGIHHTSISKIELGKAQPKLKTLVALARALEVEPDHLVSMAMPGMRRLAIEPPAGEPSAASAGSRTLAVREATGAIAAGQGSMPPEFVVLIRRTHDGYTAMIPDLPGCTASGATRQAVEAGIHRTGTARIQGLLGAGHPVPRAESYAVAMTLDG